MDREREGEERDGQGERQDEERAGREAGWEERDKKG